MHKGEPGVVKVGTSVSRSSPVIPIVNVCVLLVATGVITTVGLLQDGAGVTLTVTVKLARTVADVPSLILMVLTSVIRVAEVVPSASAWMVVPARLTVIVGSASPAGV